MLLTENMREMLLLARRRKKLTQAAVAKAVGVTRPYYSAIELGKRRLYPKLQGRD